MLAAHRRRVATWRAGELGGAHAHAMHLDVVGMAVATAFVVGGDDLGVFLFEDRRELARRLFHVGGPERSRGVVGRRVDHARVAVAEELDARDAEHLCRPTGFVGTPVAELLRHLEHAVVDLAEIAARREHEHHTMARVGRERERAGDEDGLVVGVRVEGHERSGHRCHRRTRRER